LNGYEIGIKERCKGLLDNKVFNEEGIEKFKLELLWEKFKPNEDTESLNLSGSNLVVLRELPTRLLHLPKLKHLDLSDNQLTSLDELSKILNNCLKVTTLDLRDNLFEGELKDLVTVIKINCGGLAHVFLERSLKKYKNIAPKEYSPFVFSQIPTLETVDNLPPPDKELETTPRRIKSVFDVFNDKQESRGSLPNLYGSAPSSPVKQNHQQQEVRQSLYLSTPPPPAENPHFNSTAPQSPPPMVLPQEDLVYPAFAFNIQSSAPPLDDDQSYSPQPTEESLYPDLGNFNTDTYLPHDYKDTIGKKWDLGEFQKQLEQTRSERGEKDEDEE